MTAASNSEEPNRRSPREIFKPKIRILSFAFLGQTYGADLSVWGDIVPFNVVSLQNHLSPKTSAMDFTLRPWKNSDLESLVRYADNPNIAKFMTNGFPHPYTVDDGREFLSMASSNSGIFAIDVAGEAVGSIGIFPQSDIHEKSAEMGYWLAEPYWGKGMMTRVIREVVQYGFRTFDITRIFARPFSINPASHRVLEKAGFVCEARLKDALYKNGEYMDELIYVVKKTH